MIMILQMSLDSFEQNDVHSDESFSLIGGYLTKREQITKAPNIFPGFQSFNVCFFSSFSFALARS